MKLIQSDYSAHFNVHFNMPIIFVYDHVFFPSSLTRCVPKFFTSKEIYTGDRENNHRVN